MMDMSVPTGGTCGGGACWKTTWKAGGAIGFHYRNDAATPAGVIAMKLRAGVAGRGRVEAKGKGTNLPIPALGLASPVTVQFNVGSGSICWQTTYTTAIRNTASEFSARGP